MDSNGATPPRVPSFMKPTASVNRKLSSRSPGDSTDVDAARLVSRDVGPGFKTTGKPFPPSTRRAASPGNFDQPQQGWSRPRPAQEPENDQPLPDSWDRVKVFVRIRPALWAGETPGALELDENDEQKVTVHRQDGLVAETRLKFDTVLNADATQQDVYAKAVHPIVEDVLMGYNGTVMAYGQTGAGKTFTLANMDPKAVGMMPRAMADIFNHAATDVTHTYRIYMSYVQIYMEIIKDLLLVSSEQLQIREDTQGIFLSNVHEEEVKTTQDCLKLLQRGDANRVFASTDMNAHSSRSHAIVIVTVYKQRKRPQMRMAQDGQEVMGRQTTMGRMFLVDLAGSERLKKSKSVGVRATEAKHINQSLTTLGMCVYARADPDSSHIPFRDSKLTRLLQESLGGNAKTSMIIAVSDVKEHSDETLQSLLFGSRAILVRTEARVNQFIDLSAINEQIAAQLELMAPETALERALLEREEENERLLMDLRKSALDVEQARKRHDRGVKDLLGQVTQALQERDAGHVGMEALVAQQAQQQRAFETEHAKLQAQLRTAQDENEQLRCDAAKQDTVIAQLRDALLTEEAKLIQTQEEYAIALQLSDRAHRHRLADTITTLSSEQKLEREGTVSALNERMERTTEAHAATLRETGERHQQEIDDLNDELFEARSQATNAQAQLATVEAELEFIRSERDTHKAAASSAAAVQNHMRYELEATARFLAETSDARDARDTRANALEAELDGEQYKSSEMHRLMSHVQGGAAGLRKQVRTLTAEVARLQERLSSAIETQQRALVRRGGVQRQVRAALLIQRCWRRFKFGLVVAEGQAARSQWGRERLEMSAATRRGLALNGRAMIVHSTKQVEDTIQAVLMQFLLPSKSMTAVRKARAKAGIRSVSSLMSGGSRTGTATPMRASNSSAGGSMPLSKISGVLLRSANELELLRARATGSRAQREAPSQSARL